MAATLEDDDRHLADLADQQAAGVPRDERARVRERRQVRVGDHRGVLDGLGEPTEAGAQHDRRPHPADPRQ
jgi:hypothetical protein